MKVMSSDTRWDHEFKSYINTIIIEDNKKAYQNKNEANMQRFDISVTLLEALCLQKVLTKVLQLRVSESFIFFNFNTASPFAKIKINK